MAKAKKDSGATLRIGLVNDESDESANDFDVLELARVMQEMDALEGARIMITRTYPKVPGEGGYCGEMSPSEFGFESVKETWGGGKYRWRILGPGNKFIEGGGSMTIAGHPKVAPRPGTAPAQAGEPQSLQAVLTTLDEREAARSAARMQSIKEWALILSPILVPLTGKLFGGGEAFKPADMLDMLVKMKALSPAPDSGEKFDQFVTMLEVAQKMSGGEASPAGSTWLDLAREGLGVVKPAAAELLTRLAGSSRQAAPDTPGIPGAGMTATQLPPPAAPVADNPKVADKVADNAAPAVGEAMLQHLPWLKGTLHFLWGKAQLAKNPELQAEVVLDSLPPGLTEAQLHELLSRADWWEKLCLVDPRVQAHSGWFALFRDELLAKCDLKPAEPGQ